MTALRQIATTFQLVLCASCAAVWGFDDLSGTSKTADGGAGDDGAPGDGPAPATEYHDMTKSSNWSTFDTTTVAPSASGFAGGVFDGRYVYFAPYGSTGGVFHGVVTRYDTQASFYAVASWSTFDTTTVNPSAKGFVGAAFDGRYVYLVPNNNGARDGVVVRYDTKSSFAAASSWSTFDTTTVDANAKGFYGAVFDGRYVYLVPNDNGAADGVVARFDTQANFTQSASWSTFDTTTVHASAKGFAGAAFDGRYVYLVPDGAGPLNGVVARYDTQGSFILSSSWSTFDTTTVNANAKGFHGAAFDGRYVYFVPYDYGAVRNATVARFDTQVSFTATSSWSTIETTTFGANARGFTGAGFDGRYIYLMPNYIPSDDAVARFDTHASFTAASSWSTFSTTTINPSATGNLGAVFDGRYFYLVPGINGVVARFDAKTPSSMPKLPGWSGSFF